MATNVLMPALSPTMTEGTLARWLKKEGDTVTAGDVLAEIETDKATMEVEAVDEGVLGRILVADGTAGVLVNAPIAILVEAGESVPEANGAASTVKAAQSPVSGPSAPGAPPAGPSAGELPATAAPVPLPNGHDHGARVFASPLARRMAQQAGLMLDGIRGSGPNGRIIKVDIEAASARLLAKEAPTPVPNPPSAAAVPAQEQPRAAAPAPASAARLVAVVGRHTLVPHTTMRRVIARRLTEAKQAIPHFYVAADIEIDALLKLRADLNARSTKDGPASFKLSVNDLVIKAAAVALRRVPAANASWTEDGIAQYEDVDISVAVATEGGLITPIIRRADQKGVAAISSEMKDLAARARAGKLKPDEFQGGGFSISNLGMYGVKSFSAIINPPQGGILAVGAGEPRPVVRDGAVVPANVMTGTLSVDHRVIDGAVAAEWMAAFKAIVQDPLSLML